MPTEAATSTLTRVAGRVSQGQTVQEPACCGVFLVSTCHLWNAERHQGACGLLGLTRPLGGLSLKSRQMPQMPPSQDLPPLDTKPPPGPRIRPTWLIRSIWDYNRPGVPLNVHIQRPPFASWWAGSYLRNALDLYILLLKGGFSVELSLRALNTGPR